MPYRIGSPAVQPDAPKPFSRKWLQTPPEAPIRRVPVLPKWLPSERALVGCFVLLLVFVTAFGSSDGSPRRIVSSSPLDTPRALLFNDTATTETTPVTGPAEDPQNDPSPTPTL